MAPEPQHGRAQSSPKGWELGEVPLYLESLTLRQLLPGRVAVPAPLVLGYWEESVDPSDSPTWNCHSGGPPQVKVSLGPSSWVLLGVGGSQRCWGFPLRLSYAIHNSFTWVQAE